MNKYGHIQDEAFAANRQLPGLGLVILTFGNVSAADRDLGVFAIKPSGIAYEELSPDQMVVVDFDGHQLTGKWRPSSDTATHAVLYKHWEDITAVVHTHSIYATAWAQSQRDIPIFGTTHADYTTTDIPCIPTMSDEMIQGNYEEQTGQQMIQYFRQKGISYQDVEMILIANHAPFTWGSSASKALHNSVVLESIAKMAYLTEQINKTAPRLKQALIDKHFNRKHGEGAYYGQSIDKKTGNL